MLSQIAAIPPCSRSLVADTVWQTRCARTWKPSCGHTPSPFLRSRQALWQLTGSALGRLGVRPSRPGAQSRSLVLDALSKGPLHCALDRFLAITACCLHAQLTFPDSGKHGGRYASDA